MLSAFWSGLGSEFAKQWVARILTPAFAFWAGGMVILWWHKNGRNIHTQGWTYELSTTAHWLGALPALAQILFVVVGLIAVTVSALIAERLTLTVLRLLEGYGWRPQRVRDHLITYRRRRYHRWEQRVERLATRQRIGMLKPEELLELSELEKSSAPNTGRLRELQQRRADGLDARMTSQLGRGRTIMHSMPRQDALGMPTRLGDLLRAAERRPIDRYGLDPISCWTALWLLLPAQAKVEIVQARSELDNAARTWIWGALFAVWTPWNWIALPIALLVAVSAYYISVIRAAELFGSLVVSAFDLYRFRLYDNLHIARPASPDSERHQDGRQVTSLLWTGLHDPGLQYTESHLVADDNS